MRALQEIIEAVTANEPATEEELRYTICAISALCHFDQRAMRKLYAAEKDGKKPFLTNSAVFQGEESHRRWQAALSKPPKEYVGHEYDPANPDYQRRRKAATAVFNKIASKVLDPKHGN